MTVVNGPGVSPSAQEDVPPRWNSSTPRRLLHVHDDYSTQRISQRGSSFLGSR
ncbi:hypothetical protein [Frankia sp. Cppng1_Ct_nod]|uniref:hypothetical protein n=1 Tax=Frankia sp. Cppng1_Ct_nod TaxID=2897162 RepID=UPI0013EFA202|nr:hypothetical protein [Frankia sp. Cppng1_Ct_nod]